jgi:hypothetical protein
MGKWLYRKPEPSDVRGVCVICNKNPQKPKSGGKFKAICTQCDKKVHGDYDKFKREQRERNKLPENRHKRKLCEKPYRRHVKDCCELCGFVPEDMCQLDVDHIDGNHKNNDITNLQTLCANCHRLKTKRNRDWEKRGE